MKKAILFFSFLVNVAHAQWQQTNGPGGGSIQCLASTGSNIFAGTYNGIYLSSNSGTTWYLRTNLRWFPNLPVTTSDNLTVPFDQLEFNFIQLVIFPGRFFYYAE